MNIKHHKLLHYLLIVLLMLAPLRNVMALQQSHCDMAAETVPAASASAAVFADMHAHHDMSSMVATDSTHKDPHASASCCCCDGDACSGDCDMGMTVSLFIQPSNYTPLLNNVAAVESISSTLIVRELSPPSRPPACLHS